MFILEKIGKLSELDAFDFIVLSIFLLGIFGIIALIIYAQIKNVIFKKKSIPVKVKVKKVERIENQDGTLRGYDTTFEFEYKGILKEETIFGEKNLKLIV